MKKALIIIASIFVVLIAAAILIPIVFKDDIKAAIDREIAKSVNAEVVFDADDFSLSLFKNFPNITASLKNLGVINRAPFEGKVLMAAEKIEIEVNLKSILFADKPSIKGILLESPQIFIEVLEDGAANYDIMFPSEEDEEKDEPSEFDLGIDHWEVRNGIFEYDDKSMPFFMLLEGLNVKGNGNITQDVFDLYTDAKAESLTVRYDGVEYLTKKQVQVDATIAISEEFSRYTFKENLCKVNEFGFGVDGWLTMEEDGFGMDIQFAAKENTFKSLLSLVPGMFTEDFGTIITEGTLGFDGHVRGKYTDDQMPSFRLALLVNDGLFQYPDLPTAVRNIQMDMLVDNPDGVVENTRLEINKFHMDFGSNPFDAYLLVENLKDYKMKAQIQASLNLGELTTMFPIEGMSLKGTYKLDAKAEGIYDSATQRIPTIDATMSLANGYVKTSDFPIPLENLRFQSRVTNSSGKMDDLKALVENFGMRMDGEEFTARLVFENLANYTWDLKAQGGIDLEKITKIFPIEGMNLAGKIKASIDTKGKMSDLEAERYDRIPTSGSMQVTNFIYKDAELPYDVKISTASASFDPNKIQLTSYKSTIGKSDMDMDGVITNYMGYLFTDNQVLKGTVNFRSKLLDLDQFMEGGEPDTEEAEAPLEVIPIPRNIEFVLKSTIDKVIVTGLTMEKASGDILVKDGIANLSNLRFNMLGGEFTVAGSYNTQDPTKPLYDFKLGIKELSIAESFNTFTMVQKFAPIAKGVTGKLSTDFAINGALGQDMMPLLNTVSGSGLLRIAQATLANSGFVSQLSGVTKLGDANQVSLKNVVMAAEIKDGRLNIQPFNASLGNYATTIEGSTGVDGSLAYALKMDVPAGKLGSELASFMGGGLPSDPNKTVPLNIGIGGSFTNPTFRLIAEDQKEQAKAALTEAAKEKTGEALRDALKGTQAEGLVGGLLGKSKSDTTKTDSTATKGQVQELKKTVEEEAKSKVKTLLKKKN